MVALRVTAGFLASEGTMVELAERTAPGTGVVVPPGALTLPLAPTVVHAVLPAGMAAASTGVLLLAKSAYRLPADAAGGAAPKELAAATACAVARCFRASSSF
jgi:hypothetical protein